MAEMTAEKAAESLDCIDRNVLIKGIGPLYDQLRSSVAYAASLCRKLASGELREVVHGHWHENWKHMDGRINRDCSVCHGRTNDYTPTPICPWCGAVMDGKDGRDGKTD